MASAKSSPFIPLILYPVYGFDMLPSASRRFIRKFKPLKTNDLMQWETSGNTSNMPFKQLVLGSNPSRPTTLSTCHKLLRESQ